MKLKKNGDVPIPKIAFEMTLNAQLSALNVMLEICELDGFDSKSEIGIAMRDAINRQLVVAVSCWQKLERIRPGMPSKTTGIIADAMTQKRVVGRPKDDESLRKTVAWVNEVVAEKKCTATEAVRDIVEDIKVRQRRRSGAFKDLEQLVLNRYKYGKRKGF